VETIWVAKVAIVELKSGEALQESIKSVAPAAAAARDSYGDFLPGQHVNGDGKHKNHADKGVALEKRFVDAGKIES
jgi:hypothetical protein